MIKFKNYAATVILGCFIGAATILGQKFLPINFNFLANSGAVWLIPAFFASYYSKSSMGHSIALCIVCLLFCVIGYYLSESIMNSHRFSFTRWQVIWMVMSFLAGSVFGLGAYFANHSAGILQYCGKNLLPAVFFSEGASKLIHLSDYSHMIPAVIMITCIGLILYFSINRKDCIQRNNLLSFAALSVFGLIGYELLYRISI